MLSLFTLLLMAIVAVVYWKEGIFISFCMLVNTVISGLLTFQFWEPAADWMEVNFQRTPLQSYADTLCMVALFCLFLSLIRMAILKIATTFIHYMPYVQQFGGAFFGLLNGYLLSGFLICVFQTLPWHENFLGFQPRQPEEAPLRRYLPSDRVWLAMMRHAGAYGFSQNPLDNPEGSSLYESYETFDREGTFELRYFRYRRHDDQGKPLPYFGEFD